MKKPEGESESEDESEGEHVLEKERSEVIVEANTSFLTMFLKKGFASWNAGKKVPLIGEFRRGNNFCKEI